MRKRLALFIGKRYTSLRSRNLMVGFISTLSITGLSLGVAILIMVLSVMNGFDRELQQRILALVPHITISSGDNSSLLTAEEWAPLRAMIEARPEVAATAPQIQLQGMLVANERSHGVLLSGIEPEEERAATILEDFFIAGDYGTVTSGDFNILVGSELADSLGLTIGDPVNLISTDVSITLLGGFTRQKAFTVSGIFQVGSQLDSSLAIVHMDDAQLLYRMGEKLHGLRIQLNDLFAAERVASELITQVPGNFNFRIWTQDYGPIYQNIRLSKTLVGLLLFLLVAVAAFNVVVSLFMVVRDKEGDIAILRAMGTPVTTIRNIFLVQGFIIGLIGTGIGLGLGVIFALTVSDFVSWLETILNTQFLSADVYPVNYLPSQIQSFDIVLVCTVSLLLSLLATLYPAHSAARIDPAEALRYE